MHTKQHSDTANAIRQYLSDHAKSIYSYVLHNMKEDDRKDANKVRGAFMFYAARIALKMVKQRGIFIEYGFYEPYVQLDQKVNVFIDENSTLQSLLKEAFIVGQGGKDFTPLDEMFVDGLTKEKKEALEYLYRVFGNQGAMFQQRYHDFLSAFINDGRKPHELKAVAEAYNIRPTNGLYRILLALFSV